MAVQANRHSLSPAKCELLCAACVGKTTPAMSFLLHGFIVDEKHHTNSNASTEHLLHTRNC